MTNRDSSKLADLFKLLPGYDIYATAGESWLDEKSAWAAIEFIETCCTHIEGELAGKPFLLEPWEKAIVAAVFGWKRKDEFGREIRRFREVLIYVPRKNGKTPLSAAIACCLFFTDNERGQQNFCASGDMEQAGQIFRHISGMVHNEPEMESRARVYPGYRSITKPPPDGSFIKVLSSEAKTKHGACPHFLLIDELHVFDTRMLVDTLLTGMASINRKQPLAVFTTTADYDRPSICNEKLDYAEKVQKGVFADVAYLPVIFAAPRDADWTDEKIWAAANPNLGVSVSLDYLRRECRKAQETPAYENEFRRLHLNQKTEQDKRWLSMSEYDGCDEAIPDELLAGRACFVGIDLSSKIDLTSCVFVFPPCEHDTKWRLVPHFWIPEQWNSKREQRIKEHLFSWVKQGFIHTTPGAVIDFGAIKDLLLEKKAIYSIQRVGYDPYNATQFVTDLTNGGHFAPEEVLEVRQGMSLSESCKELERLLKCKGIGLGANPVLRWNASNACIYIDRRDNIWPDKQKSSEKIDGICATATGMHLAMKLGIEPPSIYETTGAEWVEVG
jgi:phage terminase large subunit-like protein